MHPLQQRAIFIEGKQRKKSFQAHIDVCCPQETSWSHWLKRKCALPEHVRQEQIRATKCKNAKHAAAESKGEEIARATGHAVNLANPTSKWAKWIFTFTTCYVRDMRMLVRHMCDKKDRATYLTKAKKHST
jgi:hypothetical protein